LSRTSSRRPTASFVEKVINAIDANLTRACFAAGIDPEGPDAPMSMTDAVDRLFHVPGGRLGDLTSSEQRQLAEFIQVVAVGSKPSPSYLIIDKGEGQTPKMQPTTFLSIAKANKMKIPFVQGKFNSGGTGALPFCGKENMQLVVSRRNPQCPVASDDETADLWGFTLIRRVRPADGRRTSRFYYLAPGGRVPTFAAAHVRILPETVKASEPARPYALPLESGTCIKLYNYRWSPRSLATTDVRYELERYLHQPCLPFRVIETRPYSGHYFATTVMGIWATIGSGATEGDEDAKVEEGYPSAESVNIEGIGKLPYTIAVFKPEVKKRRVPHGIHFAINGQSHGQPYGNFIGGKLDFAYLADSLLVSVDCTAMSLEAMEDFFMGVSRSRP